MNEGLNLLVFEPTTESPYDQTSGWLEETKAMVERGMRQFDHKRGTRGITFRERTHMEVAEALAKRKKNT